MKQETFRFRLSSGEDVLITTNEIIDLIEGHWRWTPEAKTIKRNKQVDVPTEAWQKNVERRLDGYEDLLKDLGTFIYENNLTADEAREFLNNRFMR